MKNAASITSLRKCPPSRILIKPKIDPKNSAIQKNILFFVMKNKTIIEKPTAASPETKEQLELQASENWNQGVKLFTPPNCKISLGLALPQEFFNKILTTTIRLKNIVIKIKITSLIFNLKLK